MLKKLLIIIFICCYLVVPLGVSATSTEPQTETQTETIMQSIEPNLELDRNDSTHMSIYCFGFLAGCLLAQAFSFWKW